MNTEVCCYVYSLNLLLGLAWLGLKLFRRVSGKKSSGRQIKSKNKKKIEYFEIEHTRVR